MKFNINKRLPALTLTELMVVLVIIGILILMALPNITGLLTQAYSLEARKHLTYMQSLQKGYQMQHFRYANTLTELRFEPPKLKRDGGNGVYIYTIENASKTGYLLRATASEDFDNDGVYNVWEITPDGAPTETVLD